MKIILIALMVFIFLSGCQEQNIKSSTSDARYNPITEEMARAIDFTEEVAKECLSKKGFPITYYSDKGMSHSEITCIHQ